MLYRFVQAALHASRPESFREMTEPEPPATPSDNADQVAYWNGRTGGVWATLQSRIDAVFAPLTAAALTYASPERGSAVLDIGCGAGATVLALAEAVGPSGRVLGIDVSEPMLAVAARRIEAQALAQAAVQRGDAAIYAFAQDAFDLVFSRFGVMFFADPAAAFFHIRTALRSKGRLAFACWQPLAENPWFSVPLDALRPHVAPQPAPEPLVPGPFAFANPDQVRGVLSKAGFGEIAIEPHRTTMHLGDNLAAAVDFVAQVGPTARALTETDPEARPALLASITASLAPHESETGVTLGGAIWLVSARAP